jgi:hypothetical protein
MVCVIVHITGFHYILFEYRSALSRLTALDKVEVDKVEKRNPGNKLNISTYS